MPERPCDTCCAMIPEYHDCFKAARIWGEEGAIPYSAAGQGVVMLTLEKEAIDRREAVSLGFHEITVDWCAGRLKRGKTHAQ